MELGNMSKRQQPDQRAITAEGHQWVLMHRKNPIPRGGPQLALK